MRSPNSTPTAPLGRLLRRATLTALVPLTLFGQSAAQDADFDAELANLASSVWTHQEAVAPGARVAFFPALREAGNGRLISSELSEYVVDAITGNAPTDTEIIHGRNLVAELNANFWAASEYTGPASARKLAENIGCDFVIAGNMITDTNKDGDEKKYLQLTFGRLDQQGEALKKKLPGSREWKRKRTASPSVPFGQDPLIEPIPFEDAEAAIMIERELSRIAADFERDLRVEPDLVGMLPAFRSGSEQLSALSQRLSNALEAHMPTAMSAMELNGRMTQGFEQLHWKAPRSVLWYPYDPLESYVLADLGLAATLRPTYTYAEEGALTLRLDLTNGAGEMLLERVYGFRDSRIGPWVAGLLEAEPDSGYRFRDAEVDFLFEFENALERLGVATVKELLVKEGDEEGALNGQIYIMPTATPATVAAWSTLDLLWQTLDSERLRVQEQATDRGDDPDAALATEPVFLGGERYPSYLNAKRLSLEAFEYKLNSIGTGIREGQLSTFINTAVRQAELLPSGVLQLSGATQSRIGQAHRMPGRSTARPQAAPNAFKLGDARWLMVPRVEQRGSLGLQVVVELYDAKRGYAEVAVKTEHLPRKVAMAIRDELTTLDTEQVKFLSESNLPDGGVLTTGTTEASAPFEQ